ncbi:MAG: hypothetical protein KF802_01880 [Bdellovibrionaceae bacterium]|nr:hypothetical protein [Pseudobdellovibrionaceae bacterium]MBX3033934.1 hypothetical protein [Pseudobdellovibrionaceae bacterium]
MKLWIFSLFFLPLSAWSHERAELPPDLQNTPLAQSALSVLEQAPSELQRLTGLAPEGVLYGLTVSLQNSEAVAKLHYVSQDQLNDLLFDCHSHGDHFDCHAAEQGAPRALPGPRPGFGVEIFETSLAESLALFARKVGPLSSLESITIWQAGKDVQLILIHRKGTKIQQSHMMCHQHDADHFDCHRQLDAGPGRP